MATDIVIPNLGESITEAVVSSWLKEDGEYVERDEDLVELETDKVTMPLPAPVSGVLTRGVEEGETVEVGAVLGSIDESAAPAASKQASKAEPEKVAAGTSAKAQSANAGAVAPRDAASGEGDQPSADENGARSTPLARKLAQEHRVDLARVPGTGPGGRIREQDVLAFIQTEPNGATEAPAVAQREVESDSRAAPKPAGPGRTVTRERMSQLRQRIAVRLVEAQQTAAMLTTFNECDMSQVMALRSKLKDEFLTKHGVKLGFMSFFIKACVSGLQRVPNVNSFIVSGEKGPEVERHDYCDIAVAVGTEKGLVVPVLRDCQRLSFAEIEQGVLDLATKARDGKLKLEDLQGGTFTISNGGVYGSMLSTPILNPPQSGILGMHNIIRRPIENPAKPGSGEVVVRPMMNLALSYDHRIVDGEGAVTFLKHVKECIEDPERLLVGI